MDVIKTMVGSWKMDDSATQNFDGYAAAMKMPAELIAKVKGETGIVYKVTVNGDTVEMVTSYSTGPETLNFKLDSYFTTKSMGVEVKNKFIVEGDKVIGEHTIMGNTTTSKRFLKDGRLVVESTGNGATMVHFMDKIK